MHDKALLARCAAMFRALHSVNIQSVKGLNFHLNCMFTLSGGVQGRSGAAGPNPKPLGSGGVERSLE